jgi:hypothetical protein
MEQTFKATLKIEGFHAQDVEVTVYEVYSWVKDMRDKRVKERKAVQREIDRDKRIKGREAKNIHRLLAGWRSNTKKTKQEGDRKHGENAANENEPRLVNIND